VIVNLRVYADPPPIYKRVGLLRRKVRVEPDWEEEEIEDRIYTPAILDLASITFAYIDRAGDINLQKKGTEEFFAIEYSEELFDAINNAMDNGYRKITGFVNNLPGE
jgi:hypothetical protein